MSLQKKRGVPKRVVFFKIKCKKNVEDKNKNKVEDQILKKNKRIPSVSHDT